LQEGIQRQINTALVGKSLEVIVTGWGKQPGTQTGRTPCHRVIHFAAGSEPVTLGGVTRVQVEEAFAYSLLGRRLELGGTSGTAGTPGTTGQEG